MNIERLILDAIVKGRIKATEQCWEDRDFVTFHTEPRTKEKSISFPKDHTEPLEDRDVTFFIKHFPDEIFI